MKTSKDFKGALYLIISVLLVILTVSMLMSCTVTYKCPTYSGVKKHTNPNFYVKKR